MDCQAVTYNLNGTPNAWWLDNAGGKQYFFNGSYDSLNIDQGFKCIGNHGRIQADWLLPISGFVYEQSNAKETVIGVDQDGVIPVQTQLLKNMKSKSPKDSWNLQQSSLKLNLQALKWIMFSMLKLNLTDLVCSRIKIKVNDPEKEIKKVNFIMSHEWHLDF